MARAIFPGSFNPFTIGHKSIVERMLPLFDEIIIAVGHNMSKESADNVSSRVEGIGRVFEGNGKVRVVAYDGLTVDSAKRLGADCMIRGVRSVADYEQELNLADINRRLSGIETILVPALPEMACISSSMVRELHAYDCPVDEFLP